MNTFLLKGNKEKSFLGSHSSNSLEIKGQWTAQGRQPIGEEGVPLWISSIFDSFPQIKEIAISGDKSGATWKRLAPLDDPHLISCLEKEGYSNFKMINEELCGICDFFTTRGIVVGLTLQGYEHRYCYQNFEDANQALLDWKDEEFAPGNWIKLKGRKNGKPVDEINPNWSRG